MEAWAAWAAAARIYVVVAKAGGISGPLPVVLVTAAAATNPGATPKLLKEEEEEEPETDAKNCVRTILVPDFREEGRRGRSRGWRSRKRSLAAPSAPARARGRA